MTDCEWCRDPEAQDAKDPGVLCDAHQAEHEGLSIDQMERRDRIQYEEEREWAA